MGYYVPGYHFYNIIESEEGAVLVFLKLGYVDGARYLDRYFTTLEAYHAEGGEKVAELFGKELHTQTEGYDFIEEADAASFWAGISKDEMKRVIQYLNSPLYLEFVQADEV